MSLTVALNTATSGLNAAQTGLRTVSDNIANVNTPGYVRKTVDQQQLVVNGMGVGVEVSGVKRVTDQYLQLASLTASSDASRWDSVAQYMDNAQSLFGDPSSSNFYFSRLDDVWSSFAAAGDDPASSLLRSQALFNVQDFLNESSRINTQVNELSRNLDSKISADISRANDLLEQINRLNGDISRTKVVGADASGSENAQSQLIDELSGLINVNVTQRAKGGVTVRSTEGVMLSGEGAATLAYSRVDGGKGYVTATPPEGGAAQPIQVASGEMRGLMDLRDTELPNLATQLGEFVTRAVQQINASHNASAAIPAPSSMTGRDTGLDLPTAVGGFSGQSALAVVNASGVVQRRVDINFAAGTLSVDGGAATAFTPANFLASLNTALGAFGSASFSASGALSLSAAGANGLAISEGTSAKAGRGFSAFFGLNDMIRSTAFTNYDTGLTTADPHGFTAGQQITFQVADSSGKPIRTVAVAVPAGGTMGNLLTALNDNVTGVGLYGQYSLDANGALVFASTQPANASLAVVQDATQRGAGGPSISQLFGLSLNDRINRTGNFSVDQALVSNPMKIALAQLDLTVAAGQPAITPGDGRGARALAAAGDVTTSFLAAGSLGAVSMTVSRYAAEFGGSIGRSAAAAETRRVSAEAVQAEATTRRQSVEGVNLDEELVRMMTYQQAFSASARMIQAADDLFKVLIDLR
jgi:flagellar hook-associated protein 1 FlgK